MILILIMLNEMVFYRHGYARVEAVNASYLYWEWVESASGEVFDRMVITQSNPNDAWVLPNSSGDDDDNDGSDLSLAAKVGIAIVVGIVVILIAAGTYWLSNTRYKNMPTKDSPADAERDVSIVSDGDVQLTPLAHGKELDVELA